MSRLDLLKAILPMEQGELHDYLFMILNDYYQSENVIESEGEFLFAKGEIPVLVCAHLDTVHRQKPIEAEILFDQEKKIMWSPDGIGGDDRCGVFVILSLIMQGLRPHVAFTWNEEIGGLGARAMTQKLDPQKIGVDINFVIQIDRKGHGESVYYYLENKEFENYINSFGFKTHIGTYTDICEICPDWDMAGVNLSAGYINEHTSKELIFVETLEDTLGKTIKILEDQTINPKYFEYKEAPRSYSNAITANSYYEDYYYNSYDYNDFDNADYICEHCGRVEPGYNFSNVNGYEDYCLFCFYSLEDGGKRNVFK